MGKAGLKTKIVRIWRGLTKDERAALLLVAALAILGTVVQIYRSVRQAGE